MTSHPDFTKYSISYQAPQVLQTFDYTPDIKVDQRFGGPVPSAISRVGN